MRSFVYFALNFPIYCFNHMAGYFQFNGLANPPYSSLDTFVIIYLYNICLQLLMSNNSTCRLIWSENHMYDYYSVWWTPCNFVFFYRLPSSPHENSGSVFSKPVSHNVASTDVWTIGQLLSLLTTHNTRTIGEWSHYPVANSIIKH